MQRVIKFRAWDKLTGQMVSVGWAIKFKPENKLVSGIMLEPDETPNCERIYGEWNDSDSIILMQFTGLHDKNGKEIWEGDILKRVQIVTDHPELSGAFIYQGEVVFHRGMFMVQDKDTSPTTNNFITGDVEILGNIYENPELLEKKC